MAVPLFFWQKPLAPKTYNNEQLREQHEGFERRYFQEQRTLRGWLRWAGYKTYFFSELHLLRNLVISIGVIAFIVVIAKQRFPTVPSSARLALFAGITFILAYAVIPWFENHYAGHATPILFVLALVGARYVRVSGPRGRAILRFATISCALVLSFVILRERRNNSGGFAVERDRMQKRLARDGKHLVFVRYGPRHDLGAEWVFNRADIDSSSVIWARDLGAEQNSAVIHRYGTRRKLWLLDIQDESEPYELQPVVADSHILRAH
jgi:hypothetical protein